MSKKRHCKKSSQRPPSASATTESMQESTPPACSVSTTDKVDANAVSVSNATSYVDVAAEVVTMKKRAAETR